MFLFDSFYVDERALEKIHYSDLFHAHSELLSVLKAAGRLKVVSFADAIKPYASALSKAAEQQASKINEWRDVFEQVVSIWENFRDHATQFRTKQPGHRLAFRQMSREEFRKRRAVPGREYLIRDHLIEPRPDREYFISELYRMIPGLDRMLISDIDALISGGYMRRKRSEVHVLIRAYIEHVLSNMCLSDVLGAVIHDWEDIFPIYRRVLDLSARGSFGGDFQIQRQEQVHKLFELMFPSFEPRSAKTLARALNDKRVESLRSLVSGAASKSVTFDSAFANETLRAVLKAERKIGKARNVTGWLTKPLIFVPWVGEVADKVVEEYANAAYARRVRQQHGWFYLVSDSGIEHPPVT